MENLLFMEYILCVPLRGQLHRGRYVNKSFDPRATPCGGTTMILSGGAMTHDLDYFKRVFVQAGFIRSSNASGIMGLLGVSASEKAGQLLESLLTQISESTPQETRQQKFHKFVEMLMREASTEDVGNRILHSYGMWEGLEKQFVVSPMILAMIYLLITDCQYRESSNSTCVEKTYN